MQLPAVRGLPLPLVLIAAYYIFVGGLGVIAGLAWSMSNSLFAILAVIGIGMVVIGIGVLRRSPLARWAAMGLAVLAMSGAVFAIRREPFTAMLAVSLYAAMLIGLYRYRALFGQAS